MNSNILQTDKIKTVDSRGSLMVLFGALRIFVGSLFTITGTSKLFVLEGFSKTISQLFPLSPLFSLFVALLIISLEIACGIALLMNKHRRIGILVLLSLTVSFTYILTVAIISQHHFICNCFGIIPFSLSNSNELILNFIILDALLILYSREGWSSRKKDLGMKWIFLALAGAFLYVQLTAAGYLLDRDVSHNPVNLQKINDFLINYHQDSQSARRSSHIVLIRISDFNCPPCFNDFVGYSQLIRQYYDPNRNAYQVIGLVEQSGAVSDTISIHAWGKANNVTFPLIPVPESIFQEFNFSKSCVIYQWPYGRARYVYTFPGDDSERKKLMSAFSE